MGSDSGGTGEPEERGEGENAESDHVVVDARGKERREGEIKKHEDGPDGTEEQEGVRRGRVASPPVGSINNCRAISIMRLLYVQCIKTYCKL